MRKIIKNRPKLVPLRRFADQGPYSCAYLSLLVQRDKLKAERIGRNYYTTKEWFDEYLDQHANEKKWAVYHDKEKFVGEKTAVTSGAGASGTVKKLNLKFTYYKTALAGLAVFLLVMAAFMFYLFNTDQGRVAGVEEMNVENTTIDDNMER